MTGPTPSYPSSLDLRLLARRQRWLLWAFLTSILSMCLPHFLFVSLGAARAAAGTPTAVVLIPVLLMAGLQLSGAIVMIVLTLLVMSALRVHIVWRILAIFFMFFPLANLFTLLSVNGRATGALRKAGLKVGFMGVSDADVVRLISGHLCSNCGYDLTGNVSGICSECGNPIHVAPGESFIMAPRYSDDQIQRIIKWHRRMLLGLLAWIVGAVMFFTGISRGAENAADAGINVLMFASLAFMFASIIGIAGNAAALRMHIIFTVLITVFCLLVWPVLFVGIGLHLYTIACLRNDGFDVGLFRVRQAREM